MGSWVSMQAWKVQVHTVQCDLKAYEINRGKVKISSCKVSACTVQRCSEQTQDEHNFSDVKIHIAAARCSLLMPKGCTAVAHDVTMPNENDATAL